MNTAMKGNATEGAVLHAFVERGLGVLVPFGDGHPFDLLVDLGSRHFLRVQCKTARLVRDCVAFNSRSTDHGHGPGRYTGLADVFGVYFPPTAAVYLVPVEEISALAVQLRLKPALNNQRKLIRMAADYAIERWSDDSLRKLCEIADAEGRELARQVA